MTTAPVATAASPTARPPGVVRTAFRMWRTRLGMLIVVVLVAIAFLGRYIAPYAEQKGIGKPFAKASKLKKGVDSVFGTAKVGHDVWTRFLYGGRSILIQAVLSTLLALVIGTIIGLVAAYNRRRLDSGLMFAMDVILAMPQIIIALVVLSMFSAKWWLIVLLVGISTVPRIARVVRGTAIGVVERDFVSAAEALGESKRRIIFSELLPNVAGPLLVEATLRLTFSIALIAGIGFLGFVEKLGVANWGFMINENRQGLRPKSNHWGVTLPVLAIAMLTVATGLIGDGFARAVAGLDRQKGDD